MYCLKIGNNLYRMFALVKILGMILPLTITSCECKNRNIGVDSRSQNGNLVMEITPSKLVGDQKKFEATFTLSDTSQMAYLDNFKLKILFLKQKNGTESKIEYTIYEDGKAITKEEKSIEERLVCFVKAQKLAPGDDSIRIPFSIILDPNVTKLEIRLELLDSAGNRVQEGTCHWKESDILLQTEFQNVSVEGKRPIELMVTNKGKQKIEKGTIKLKIKRTVGDHATLQGAPAGVNEFELDLGEIAVGQCVSWSFKVIPAGDKEAKFVFQYIHKGIVLGYKVKNGKSVRSSQSVHWKKGPELVLANIIYNRFTQCVYYTIENKGTSVATGVSLEYQRQFSKMGFKLRDKISLGKLAPGEKRTNQNLCKLYFGGGLQEAIFNFKLTSDQEEDIIIDEILLRPNA